MKRSLFVELMAAREAKRPVALITDLNSGAQLLLDREPIGDLKVTPEILTQARESLLQDRSGMLGEGPLFVQAFNPPLRMFVVGAVHISQALVPMARLAGFEVIVIDPRRAWATEARFPGVTIETDWPDEVMQRLKLDHRSAVIALTHDPKIDDPALSEALKAPVFYIGALGSKKTHAKRLERLAEHGFGPSDFTRIHGPIGLDIGAKSPAEIAIAILAEVTRVRRRPSGPVKAEAAA
ncbi:MAG: XdhC family protein [Kiloniellales bacterium]|nr:XdhC family protein [Kiloniellales bacterium]